MNDARRKQLDAAIKAAEAIKERFDVLSILVDEIKADTSDLRDEIEMIKDDEQAYYDNMPESLQSGDKGQAAEAAVAMLDETIDALDSFGDLELYLPDVDDLVSKLDDAKNQ